jgi:hypothetical protein
MCIRGLKPLDHDVDILVTEELWEARRQEPGWEVRLLESGRPYLWNNDVELYKDWGPGEWNPVQIIRDAEIINGLPFVQLETVLAWKRICGREKDLRHIKIIEDYLAHRY